MADRQTSTVTADNNLPVYLNRRLLKVLKEKVWLYQLCEKYPLPQGNGTQMVFTSWRRLAAASSTLAEQSSNHAVVLSSRRVSTTIVSYGRGVKVSDLLEKTSIAPPVQGAIDALNQSAALTQDNAVQRAIFQDLLDRVGKDTNAKTKLLSAWLGSTASSFCADTGTNSNAQQMGLPVVFATSATRLSAGTARTVSSSFGPIGIRKAVDRLRRLDAEPFADGNYMGVAHPRAMTSALGNEEVKRWFQNWNAGPQESMFKGIVTSPMQGVRFVLSTNIPFYATSALSANITPILGQQCVGVTELGGAVEMIVKRPGDQTTSDPYNLFSTIAYKMRIVAKVLNPSAGVNLITNWRV